MGNGHILAKLREQRGLSQQELADKIGTTQASVGHWEANRRNIPHERLVQLADFFNTTVDYLLGRDVPRWATSIDVVALEDIVNGQLGMTLGGENMTDTQIQRVKDIVKALYWEELAEQRGLK